MEQRPISLLRLLEERTVLGSTAESIDLSIGSKLNGPYFETTSRDRKVERLVISTWREFASIPRYGPAPKLFADRLLRLADRWWIIAGSNAPNTAEAALLKYNAALVANEVIRAVYGD